MLSTSKMVWLASVREPVKRPFALAVKVPVSDTFVVGVNDVQIVVKLQTLKSTVPGVRLPTPSAVIWPEPSSSPPLVGKAVNFRPYGPLKEDLVNGPPVWV